MVYPCVKIFEIGQQLNKEEGRGQQSMGERKTRVVLLRKGKQTKEGRFWLRHLIFSVCGEL